MVVSNQEQRILDVLQQYVSPLNARVLLRRACQRTGLASQSLSLQDLPQLLPAMQMGIRLFVSEGDQARALAALQNIDHQPRRPEPQRLPIEYERDIKAARAIARRICERLGSRSYAIQRAVTAVSELARNIVNYTKGGTIELRPLPTTPARLRVVAEDSGPGIPHLEEILAGQYRSRTGLGRGILGVKDLSTKFEIETSEAGTRVEIEVGL
jgi:serine/threonine-protein kinase RsbT